MGRIAPAALVRLLFRIGVHLREIKEDTSKVLSHADVHPQSGGHITAGRTVAIHNYAAEANIENAANLARLHNAVNKHRG